MVAHMEAQVLAERAADLARRELGTVLTQRYPDARPQRSISAARRSIRAQCLTPLQ